MVYDVTYIRYGRDLVILSQPSYNAGVLGLNLKKWREKNLTDEVIYWMRMNKQTPLWELGTQPIVFIVTGDDWNPVDKRWNFDGLGYAHLSSKTLKSAYILHRTGRCMLYLNKMNLSFFLKSKTNNDYNVFFCQYSQTMVEKRTIYSILEKVQCECL